MNITTKIKKIFYGLDLRNNKIINGKAQDPVHEEHIANKKYVDTKTTYDTERAKKFKNPFYFKWMTNVFGLDFKKLFDELLFPQINPEYKNPELISIQSAPINQHIYDCIPSVEGKSLIVVYPGMQKTIRIYFLIEDNDRTLGSAAQILIKIKDKKEQIFTATTNNSKTFIDCKITIPNKVDIEYIKITKQFGVASNTKQDTHGNDYIPVDFSGNYVFTEDITEKFFDSIYISPISILSRPEGKTMDDMDGAIPADMFYGNEFEVTKNIRGVFDVMLCNEVNDGDFKKYLSEYVIQSKNDMENITTRQFMGFDNITNHSTINKRFVTINNKTYLVGKIDFGSFRDDKFITVNITQKFNV